MGMSLLGAERGRLSIRKGASERRLLGVVALTAICLGSICSKSARAEEQQWSLTLIKHNNKAAEAYNNGDFRTARDEFRTAIGLNPKSAELYEGLLNTCIKSNEWDQVAFASEKLMELEPGKKNDIAYDYGQALFNLNRWEEALPWLKRSLSSIEGAQSNYKPKIHSEDIAKVDETRPAPVVAVAPPPPPPPPPREVVNPNQYVRSFDNAVKSESIVLAEYVGYDKGDIHWNSPPLATYHIIKRIKGSPLNPTLPVRYEFHDNVETKPPAGWKFNEDKEMPKKGSQWILFIEFAVAKHGMYETFQGSYGRQPATDENLNELYSLIEKYNMGIQK